MIRQPSLELRVIPVMPCGDCHGTQSVSLLLYLPVIHSPSLLNNDAFANPPSASNAHTAPAVPLSCSFILVVYTFQ